MDSLLRGHFVAGGEKRMGGHLGLLFIGEDLNMLIG